jgi:hypothetical protein
MTDEIDRIDEANQSVLESIKETAFKVNALGTEIQPATAIEMVRLATALLNAVAETPDYHEFTEDLCDLSAEATGQVVLKRLPHVLDGARMTTEAKAFWMTVADELGPDWTEAFRMVGAFMKRVESF